MMNKKCENYLLLGIALLVFAVNQIPFIEDVRPVMYDEAWYANTAYNFAHHNELYNTVVGKGGNENFVAPVIMGSMMYLFGDSLLTVRLTAALFGLLTLVVLHCIMNQLHCGRRSRLIVYAVFVSLTVFNSIFRYGRPEFASVMFSAIGLYAYLCYYQSPKWKYILLLSVSVFFAICSHPFTTLLFALIGLWLLVQTIRDKRYTHLLQLGVLLLSAVGALVLIQIVTHHYNGAVDGTQVSIFDRLFSDDMWTAICTYWGRLFAMKNWVSTIPSLFVIFLSLRKTNTPAIKALDYIVLAFILIFPILFAADLNMIGLATDYLYLVALVVTADLTTMLFDTKEPYSTALRYAYICTLLFCLGNFCLTYYFNYVVKYEKANSVLTHDIEAIIPDSAVVYGSLRQWPCKMKSCYQSDHHGFDTTRVYDYVITNLQDIALMRSYNAFFQQIDLYEPVYTHTTKQYGEVVVYRHK